MNVNSSTGLSGDSPQRLSARLRTGSRTAALSVVVVAGLVLLGWAFEVELLKRIVPGLIAMNPATAVCFVLAGASLALQVPRDASPRARRLARTAALAVATLGLVRLGGYVLGVEVGIDGLLFGQKVAREVRGPNRMAPNTALCFVLAGLALLLLEVETRGKRRPAQLVALVLGMVALLAVLGYVYGVSSLYGIGAYIPMAVNTAGSFVVLAAGVFLARPDAGLMSLVTHPGASGVLTRRLLPAVLLIPPLLGSLRLAGEHAELYDSKFGVALNVVAMMVIFASLIAVTSGTLQRLDDRRAASEAALRDQSGLLRSVLESIAEGVVVADEQARFVHWNPAAERIVGQGPTDAPPERWSEHYNVFLSDGVTAVPADEHPVIRAIRGERVDDVELLIRPRNTHQNRWLQLSARPLFDDGGSPRGGVVVFRDVTERRRLEDELRHAKEAADQANRAKSDFLATLSHELRTPLHGVIGMTELLLGTDLDAQQRRYAWLVKSSGDALLSLINDILDFSKIEAGKLELEDLEFDLRYAVESVAASLASRAENKGLELIAGVHPEVPPLVRGAPGRLQQILMNLMSNAIRFTEVGEVVIRATLEEETHQHERVRFTVNDTGIGIPHDRLTRLFVSFSQVDASTTRKYGGTGLGLAICKRLTELMGGQIGVISDQGQGSTFWFTVVLVRQPSDRSPARSVSGDLRSLRVLVVDDNATNREIMHEQLASWGLNHQTVPDGHQALAALRDAAAAGTPFGLAILDMRMPEMDGLELARAIKADARIQDTVLVLLTSLQEPCDPRQLRAEGFSAHLAKPVRQSDLLDTITEAVACATARPVGGAGGGPAASPRPSRRRGGAVKAARILLAEDHPISQEVAATMLRQAGHQCHVVANGRQALEAVLQQDYDLVLMDCQMPEMDGFACTHAIRQAERDGCIQRGVPGRLPIIALTANAIKGDRERCLEAGMDDYLSKPLNADRVLEIIESQLAASRPQGGGEGGPPPPEVVLRDSHGSPSEPAHPTRPPIDLERLLKHWGGDRDLIGKLISKFQKQAQSELRRLERSIADGETERTAQVAHALKGAASYLCAAGVRELAARLETMGRAGDLSRAGSVLGELEAELRRCMNVVGETTAATAVNQPHAGSSPCAS